MNQVQLVVNTIKKLDYYCTPLELLVELHRQSLAKHGAPRPSPLELDKILKQLYKDNKFIYGNDGTIVWTYMTEKQWKKFEKEFGPFTKIE